MSRGLDLGDVAFGLTAETNGLDRALDKLRDFGDMVNRVAKSTDESSIKATQSYIRQEKAITAAYQKVLDLNAAIRQSGAPISQLADVTKTFSSLTGALTKGELDSLKFSRAQEQITARLNESTRALKAFKDEQQRNMNAADAISSATLKVGRTQGVFERAAAPQAFGDNNAAALNAYTAAVNASKGNTAALAAAQRDFNSTLARTDQEYKTWIANQRTIEKLQTEINALTRAGTRVNLPGIGNFQNSANNQLGAIQSAFAAGNTSGATAGMTALRKTLSETEDSITRAANTAGKWSFVMRDLERATVLAMGPLSGIGARMAVLAALFESTSVKNALFVAGVAGMATGFALLATEAVKTTMKFQQWNAQMITASGTQVLVADDMKFVIEQSQKFGQSIESTIPSYTKFAASARLSGLAVDDIRKTFTAFMTAGAANHWGVDQTSNAFLALEQVMSKGTVQTEEIKKQLGNVLPGAFELAAAAIGKTTSEFTNLLKKGEILSVDFMPKFAAMVEKVNAAGAAAGMKSLSADLGRLHNDLDLLFKSFDDEIHASKAFQIAVEGLSSLLVTLKDNVDKIIPSLGAMAGFFIGMAAPSVIGGIATLVGEVGTLVTLLKEGEKVISILSLITIPFTGAVALFARIGLAIGGAAVAYDLLSEKTDKVKQGVDDYTAALKLSLDAVQHVGSVSQSVHDRTIKNGQEQLKLLNAQITAQMLLITTEQAKVGQMSVGPDGTAIMTGQGKDTTEMQDKILAFAKAKAEIQKLMAEFEKVTVVPDASNGPKVDAHLKGLVDETNKLINSIQELKAAQDTLKAGGQVNDEEITHAKALEKAKDFVEKIDVASNRSALSAMLNKAGFAGKNLVDQFTALYELQGKLTGENKSFEKANNAQGEAQATINEEVSKYNALLDTGDKIQGEIAKKLSTMDEMLKKNHVADEQRNALLREYNAALGKTAGANKSIDDAKKLDEINKSIDRFLGNHKADLDEVNKKYDDMILRIQESGEAAATADKKIAALNRMRGEDLFKAAENANEGIKIIHESLLKMGDDGTKALSDMFRGVKVSAKDFFGEIIKQMEEMVVKLLIIKPLMESLFGDMYTGGKSGGGGILGSIFSAFGFNTGASTAASSTGSVIEDTVDTVIAHGGGTVGTSSFQSRSVPSSTFSGAPRYHSGLASDEFPAILQRGEDVRTKAQRTADERRMEQGTSSSGGMTNNISVSVAVDNQGNTNSKVSGSAGGALLGDKLAAAIKAVILQEKSNGGMLSAY